jgi:hypothetical protein
MPKPAALRRRRNKKAGACTLLARPNQFARLPDGSVNPSLVLKSAVQRDAAKVILPNA